MPASTEPRNERRRHPRALTNLSATLVVGARSHPARVVNLSLGGALLNLGDGASAPALATDDPVEIVITQRGRKKPFQVAARAVLWNRVSGPVPLLAIQFGEMSDDNAELLDELLFEALSVFQYRALTAAR